MCPHHHFAADGMCPFCRFFCGGFVGGFFSTPFKWYSGGRRIYSQGGAILAAKGRPEEEENRQLGQQARAVYRVYRRVNVQAGQEAWAALPILVRQRFVEQGYQGLGSLAGGLVGTQVFLFALSFLGGRLVARYPRLRPLRPLGQPMLISASALLSLLAVQGSCAMIIARQREIFADFPESEELFHETLDRITKDEDDEGGPTSGKD